MTYTGFFPYCLLLACLLPVPYCLLLACLLPIPVIRCSLFR
ncbi:MULTISPECIES: hypothetical protein [unclassified Moorena]|nr:MULTISPECIES: hypothetical protein [unclassified Moorena]